MIRLSSQDYKVAQKMTALFLAIKFELENENINDSVNFVSLLRSRKCFMFSALQGT